MTNGDRAGGPSLSHSSFPPAAAGGDISHCPSTSITVVCGATRGAWTRRARRALDSVAQYSPGVRTILHEYVRRPGAGDADRLQGILKAQTPWILSIDADVLATGDVRFLPGHVDRFSERPLIARKSPLHHHPLWRHGRYVQMLVMADLAYRSVVWNGAFFIRRELAERVVPRLAHWTQWYLSYRPLIFEHKHPKPGQHAFTLALADALALDRQTHWFGPEAFSWHSHPRELGLIHHFSGKTYVKLEKEKGLEAAIERRREQKGGSP